MSMRGSRFPTEMSCTHSEPIRRMYSVLKHTRASAVTPPSTFLPCLTSRLYSRALRTSYTRSRLALETGSIVKGFFISAGLRLGRLTRHLLYAQHELAFHYTGSKVYTISYGPSVGSRGRCSICLVLRECVEGSSMTSSATGDSDSS